MEFEEDVDKESATEVCRTFFLDNAVVDMLEDKPRGMYGCLGEGVDGEWRGYD